MDISIIIVNYNVKYFLEQCLYSVKRACTNINAEIFVVDNNSTDGSREYLEERFPGITFKWNEKNVGFAKANNSVLRQLKGNLVLFLNPDTIVPEDCFEKCISFFLKNPACGALGVRMIDGTGNFLQESKRSLPLPLVSFFKMSGLARIFPKSKTFSRYYAGHLPEDSVNEVDVLPGAFFMAEKKAIDMVGGFDEDFFMYGEDIDLSFRIQKAGYKNYYFPETTIIHFKGESTQKNSALYQQHFYGAMKLFINKHFKRNLLSERLMLMAINFGKNLSVLKQKLKRNLKAVTPRYSMQTIVVGEETNITKLVKLVMHAKPSLLISKNIIITPGDYNHPEILKTRMNNILLEDSISHILFCQGLLTFKDIIKYAMDFKGRVNFLFYSEGSRSIVGSSNKNKNGIFISE